MIMPRSKEAVKYTVYDKSKHLSKSLTMGINLLCRQASLSSPWRAASPPIVHSRSSLFRDSFGCPLKKEVKKRFQMVSQFLKQILSGWYKPRHRLLYTSADQCAGL